MGLRNLVSHKKKHSSSSLSITSSLHQSSRSSSMASNTISRAQIEEEFTQVFKKFDVNGDNKISSSELSAIMGSLGNETTYEELDMMIQEVDADDDGFIDLQEFIELNTKDIDSNEVLENLKEAFSVFDMDKNDSISAEELMNVMKSIDEECLLAECWKMISDVDANGDGMINFDEFKAVMMKVEKGIFVHKNLVKCHMQDM